jgi:Predicted membrane protein
MYCHKCGKELDEDAVYCSFCGAPVDGNADTTSFDRATQYVPYVGKSVGTALVLGFFLPGLGHIYIGKLARGLCIMIGYILLEIMTLFVWLARFNNSYFEYNEFVSLMALALIFSIPAFALQIWNLFDVNKLGKEYNDCIRKTGNPPW